MLNQNRAAGVSFIVRARNEADALFRNLLSLRALSIPHEILVVLHRCTDCSEEVVNTWRKQGSPVTAYIDNTPVSRAGYETLITPQNSPHSFSSFTQRAFERANYNWLIRWDADFEATQFFRDFVNDSLSLGLKDPYSYQLGCAMGETCVCHEEYMTNTFLGCKKYLCWEIYEQELPRTTARLPYVCIKTVPPTLLKEYWNESPWFLQPDTYNEELAKKYEKLVSICGPEPPGFARSNGPNFEQHFAVLQQKLPELIQQGVYVEE